MSKQNVIGHIKEASDILKEGGARMQSTITKTALSLDETLNFSFPIDETTVKIYEEIIKGLNITTRRLDLDKEINATTGSLVIKLNGLETRLLTEKSEADGVIIPNKDKDASGYESKSKEKSRKLGIVQKTEEEIKDLKEIVKKKDEEYKALEIFAGGLYEGATKSRKKEVEEIKEAMKYFKIDESFGHNTINIGEGLSSDIDLSKFEGTPPVKLDFCFYDEKQNKKIGIGDALSVSATTSSGSNVQVTLKGVTINPTTKKLSITDLQVEGDVTDAPIIIRDLYIRAVHQHGSGRMFYHDKKLSLNINNPVATFDLVRAYSSVKDSVDRQLDHTYDRNYKNIRKEVIFKLIESNNKSQFEKLSDEQKEAFINGLTTTGYDIVDKIAFRKEYEDLIVSEGFKGTESQFKSQLLENIDKKSEEKLKKILEDRLDTKNIGTKNAKAAIVGDFITYFASTDIDKNKARRETQYNAINTRTGGQIDRQLGHIHTTKYDEVKKTVLLKLLEETNKTAFDKLSDKQKDTFVESLITTGYDLDIPTFQTAFRDEITKDDFSGTEEEFEKQLLTNFDSKAEEKLKKILEDRLDSTQIGGHKSRSTLVGNMLNFLNNSDINLAARHTTLGIIEGNLSAEYLETRLRQDYENKFNKVQREAFEKVLGDNPEFAKLNQAQKDRLYERMQDLGTIANPVKPIVLGKPATGTTDVTYPVNDITFAPSTHDYSVMPNGEDYNGFKVWLANQAPKDVINDEEKYRQWLRNGLVASLDNGKTHYESFFEDVLKQFTDDLNVKTTLNKTLLDFINDTNEADHVGFEADLAATLNATEPLTTHTKKRYQRLAFWTRGEPQNYLSFFSGQSHEFKNESITAGGKTFGYTGKLDIHGAQSMSMSLKMKEGQEQIYTGGNPVALVRTLLNSPDIEPPHARFHAGLSVVKSVTKIARENGISLRTALTPEMLETLPLSIRTTLENGENPMVEIEEENGKLVAKVFNLNLTTRRKENEYKMFDEQDFIATQSVRDLRQGVQGLLALTNQTMNSVYSQYREARFRSGLRPGLLRKPRYGGLRNGYKKLSFTGESISVGGKSFNLDCKDGLFTFSGGDLKKPVKGRNLGDLLAYNAALRGVELKAIRVANEKMLAMYQEKLKKQERHHNYGVIDEENHRVYIYDKNGNLGYYESNDQTFVQRWRQYTSGHRYGRIADENMPTGFRVMKRGDTVVDSESYENFLRNETVVGSMVRAMSRTHRALIAMDPR